MVAVGKIAGGDARRQLARSVGRQSAPRLARLAQLLWPRHAAVSGWSRFRRRRSRSRMAAFQRAVPVGPAEIPLPSLSAPVTRRILPAPFRAGTAAHPGLAVAVEIGACRVVVGEIAPLVGHRAAVEPAVEGPVAAAEGIVLPPFAVAGLDVELVTVAGRVSWRARRTPLFSGSSAMAGLISTRAAGQSCRPSRSSARSACTAGFFGSEPRSGAAFVLPAGPAAGQREDAEDWRASLL